MKARVLLLVATLLAAPLSARASTRLDPSHAARDAHAVVEQNDFAFCSSPPKPLPSRAIDLCPLAKEMQGCDGLVAACKALEEPIKPPPNWLVELMRALGPIAQVLIWVGLAVVLALLLVPLVRMYLKRRRDKQVQDAIDEPKPEVVTQGPLDEALLVSDAEQLLRRAEEAQKRGDLVPALDAYLAASLVALDHRGAIRIARHKTNGEYVRGCSEPQAKQPLREIVREFDGVHFGHRAPSADSVSRVASRAVTLVRGAAVATLLLMTMLLAGCPGGSPLKRGNDPAGEDVLVELLRKQGATVGRPGRLASLPIPKAGETAPVVIVDFTKTPLDDETREHLVRWVKHGGTLVAIGAPASWPKPLSAKHEYSTSRDVTVTTWESGEQVERHARIGFPAAFSWDGGFVLGQTGDGLTYAQLRELGEGKVLGIAGPDLFTNVGLASGDNAATTIALLANLESNDFRIAHAEDGTAAATNPFAALVRAGLGPALVHGLIAVALLFLAVGVRLSRPTPTLPPRRRAFVEHVEATGAFWARARIAPHALATYARWADERLRGKMPRGTQDVPGFLAQRAGAPADECNALWARAQEARTDETPKGDELATLKKLSDLFVKAER